jgi:hypothetical protein
MRWIGGTMDEHVSKEITDLDAEIQASTDKNAHIDN